MRELHWHRSSAEEPGYATGNLLEDYGQIQGCCSFPWMIAVDQCYHTMPYSMQLTGQIPNDPPRMGAKSNTTSNHPSTPLLSESQISFWQYLSWKHYMITKWFPDCVTKHNIMLTISGYMGWIDAVWGHILTKLMLSAEKEFEIINIVKCDLLLLWLLRHSNGHASQHCILHRWWICVLI